MLAVAVNRGALAGDFDWMNKDQMSAVSTLAAGYAGGLRCDRLVDSAVAGAFLTKAFGGRSFSAQEVAAIGTSRLIAPPLRLKRFRTTQCRTDTTASALGTHASRRHKDAPDFP